MDPLPPDAVRQIVVILAICNGVSMLGCFFNIFTAYYLKTVSHVLGKVVAILSLMDLIFSIAGPMAAIPLDSGFYCRIVSLLVGLGLNGSLIWTCCFAFSFLQAIKQQDLDLLSHYFRKSMIVTVTFSIIQAIYATVAPFKENVSKMCIHQIRASNFDYDANLIVLLPMLLSTLFCMVCYVIVYRKIKEASNQQNLNLLVYPLILIICSFPIVSLTIIKQLYGPTAVTDTLMIIANALWGLQGFFNALAYGLSSEVIRSYRMKCCRRAKSIKSSMASDNSYSSPLFIESERSFR